MLFELLEAFQVGKEAGNVIENLYNGDHYDAVDKAYEMAQSLDVNDHYNEGVQEILDQLSVVDNNDRDFVKAAAYELRARCYFDLGDYSKARQNITACLNIQIDSFTLEKDSIREHQASAGQLLEEIKALFADTHDNNSSSKTSTSDIEATNANTVNPVLRKELNIPTEKEISDFLLEILEYRIQIDRNTITTHERLGAYIHSNAIWRAILSDIEYAFRENLDEIKDDCWRSDMTVSLLVSLITPEEKDGHLWYNKRVQKYVDSKGSPVYGKPLPPWAPFSMDISNSYVSDINTIVSGSIHSGEVKNGDSLFIKSSSAVFPILVKNVEKQGINVPIAEEGDFVALTISCTNEHITNDMSIVSQVSIVNPRSSNLQSMMSKEQEYLNELKECLADGEIGPRERRLLDKFASKLGISPERVAELEATLSAPMLTDDEKEYLEEVQAVLADGEISEKERRLLEKLKRILNITEDRAKEIEGLASHRQ